MMFDLSKIFDFFLFPTPCLNRKPIHGIKNQLNLSKKNLVTISTLFYKEYAQPKVI